MSKRCILITGGARSGKSQFAQEMAAAMSRRVIFVATAQAGDEEMKARIEAHRQSRPRSWRTLEIPLDPGERLLSAAADADVILIDCLTLLVANLLGSSPDNATAERKVTAEIKALLAAMARIDSSFLVVTNEVGLGLVPDNPAGRLYRDLLGRANQLVAGYATEVYLMVSGIPLKIKGNISSA